jgi:hypothetical protein
MVKDFDTLNRQPWASFTAIKVLWSIEILHSDLPLIGITNVDRYRVTSR